MMKGRLSLAERCASAQTSKHDQQNDRCPARRSLAIQDAEIIAVKVLIAALQPPIEEVPTARREVLEHETRR